MRRLVVFSLLAFTLASSVGCHGHLRNLFARFRNRGAPCDAGAPAGGCNTALMPPAFSGPAYSGAAYSGYEGDVVDGGYSSEVSPLPPAEVIPGR